jgi:membrane protein DedA with SNARE-associated domain
MHRTIEFLLHHGYVVLLAWVFAEQSGVPVPSIPLLLAAGALAGSHQLNIFASLFVVTLAAVAADSICKITIEPDSCVRRTEGVFSKQGARSLILAKFLPGLSTVAPPLAGIFHMRPRRFLLFDTAGSFLWASTFLGLGYLFSGEIERIAERAASLGGWLIVILIGALASYLAYKFLARRRFLRELRIARITVEELKQKLDAGEEVVIVDLRHSVDFEADPETIPGAFRMDAQELEQKNDRLPRDREIILYCT